VSLYSTLYASSSVPRNPMDLVFTRRNVDTGNTDFPVRIPSQSPPRNQWTPVPFPEYCLGVIRPHCIPEPGASPLGTPPREGTVGHSRRYHHHRRHFRHHAEDPKHEPRCIHPRFPLRTKRQRARSIPSSASSRHSSRCHHDPSRHAAVSPPHGEEVERPQDIYKAKTDRMVARVRLGRLLGSLLWQGYTRSATT